MSQYAEIFENNKRWKAQKLQEDDTYFEKLGQGQNPEYLYIGCSDSRVSAEEIMGFEPGELFVHRNVANLVIPTDNNLNAVVQYAVEFLKVKHIIVCGHYGCGGIYAALQHQDMGQLNSWLQTLRDVYRTHHIELDAITDEKQRYDRLVELNILEQCINLFKIDHVQRAWHTTGYPQIHGWVFDIHTGDLKDLKLDMECVFADLGKIYALKQV